MATRINRKNASTASPKEVVTTEKGGNKTDPHGDTASKPATGTKTVNVKTVAKRLNKKKPPKKLLKKPSFTIKLKAKAKKPVKINPKLAKNIFHNVSTLENRKKILKNGVKEVKPKKRKTPVKKEKYDLPPVLEPIFPLEENLENKKQTKKRVAKKPVKSEPSLIHIKKIKVENDDNLSVSSDVTDISNNDTPKQSRKGRQKKPKSEESLEDVINDLSYLLKTEDIKKEIDSMSESSKSDIATKPKKLTKKQQIELLKKKIIKKENIENTLSKLDSSDEKIIDMLDLNVRKVKKKSPIAKRRHSIEKFPVSTVENIDSNISQFSLFNHLPRSISPRSKRAIKVRQSVDGINRRASPYTTRSDSPARILRNGKQRKLKDVNLLDGLDSDSKRRKRLCSDLSASDVTMMTKISGYESDSSFSDLASHHSTDNNDLKDMDTKIVSFEKTKERGEVFDEDNEIKSQTDICTLVKQSPSLDTATNGPTENIRLIDTNSNLCNNINPEDVHKDEKTLIKDDDTLYPISPNISVKVPEKSIILDIMKQTFNTKKVDQKQNVETDAVETSKFYGKTIVPEEEKPSEKPPAIVEEITPMTVDFADNPISAEQERSMEKSIETILNSQVLNEEIEPEPMEVDSEIEVAPKLVEEVTEEINTENENESSVVEETCKVDVEPKEPSLEPPHLEPEVLESLIEETEEECVKSNDVIEVNGESVVDDPPEVTLPDSESSKEERTNFPVENCDRSNSPPTEESAEELAEKENILKALGLQSLRAAEEAKQKIKEKPIPKIDNSYTGTLKTVIKINRDKKKGRSTLKMTLQKNKGRLSDGEQNVAEDNYKIMKEGPSTSWKQGNQSSDTAGAQRKYHYYNRSNLDGSSEHTSDGEAPTQDGAIKALVIPEKASSFSIHPGRLCKDECSYCFGKFGLFDTPCHIAQIKSIERQNKILDTEKHLTTDSCLCDACYRHVDRKSNTPSYTNKSLKRNSMVAPGPRQNHCHVLGCNKVSSNVLRRKWIIKMKKSIYQVINIDLDNPGLHSIPICDEHYSALEHLMICAMCKRRLARNHIHYLGPETNDLNVALNDEGIPLKLTDKPVVCKLCKCFASIILKDPEERPENSVNFFKEYKRRLLHFNDIVPMNEADAEEPIAVPSKSDRYDQVKKKSKKAIKDTTSSSSPNQTDSQESNDNPEKIQERVPSTDSNSQPQSRSESPSDEYNGVDYNTLIPAIAMDCGSDSESKKEQPKKSPIVIKRIPRLESVKDAVEISKVSKKITDKNKNSDVVVQRLGSNPSISVRQLFPGEEDLPLASNIEFNNVKERTPEGWDKCVSTIQYDAETKRLWQELQKPYGNQSSFMRHLILLEKYFRNGDLILSPTASHHSINYSESVHNRLRAYDNIPTNAGNIQPLSMLPFNKMQKSNSGIITSTNATTSLPLSNNSAISVTSLSNSTPKSTPLTLSQLNSPPLIPANAVLQQVRPKMVGTPPGLISLHPGTSRPVAPLVKVPQAQKIKFPITKNWRPNLIPIDPSKKQERKAGLVQVISGGKPYHITLEDYKKMCAIKRSFEMKQKQIQEAQNQKPILVTHNSVLKSIIPRKGLIISKTATVTSLPKSETPKPNTEQNDSNADGETYLDKLDKQVEKLESKFNEKPSSLLLPKIPKSLTVIPQTVTRKPSRPSSPVLLITSKNNSSNKS